MKVRGVLLKARVLWVVKHHGEGGMEKVKPLLTPQTLQTVKEGVFSSTWYPLEQLVDINVAIDRVFGRGDYELCEELGRFSCESNIPTIYRLFFAVGSISYIIRRTGAAWRVSYDTGNLVVLDSSSNNVRFRMEGDFPRHRAHCIGLRGWILQAGQLSGAKVMKASEKCRCWKDPECEFDFTWK